MPTTLVSFVFLLILFKVNSVRVCNNFHSYYYPDEEHCFDNKDPERNITEIVREWGFKAEEYDIITPDEYQVLLVRVYKVITEKTPIFLGHGIRSNGAGWVSRKEKSLAYYFGVRGFDIWIINFRGTIYSKQHKSLSANRSEYWKFGLDEMAQYDLPSALDIMYKKTNEKAVFVGFSMSSTISYMFASKFPKKAEEWLRSIISLSPVAYLVNIKSFVKYLAPFENILKKFVYTFLHGEFPSPSIIYDLCGRYPFMMFTCSTFTGLIFGLDYPQMDPMFVPISHTIIPDSIGAGVLEHYTQIYKSGRFQARDFGPKGNKMVYGQASTPLYNLSEISVPVILFFSGNDWIATEENVLRLYHELNSAVRMGLHRIKLPQFAHHDFMEALDIISLLYEPLYSQIKGVVND